MRCFKFTFQSVVTTAQCIIGSFIFVMLLNGGLSPKSRVCHALFGNLEQTAFNNNCLGDMLYDED